MTNDCGVRGTPARHLVVHQLSRLARAASLRYSYIIRGISSPGWDALEQELSAFHSRERKLKFWWRDDDATAVTEALERLLDTASSCKVPLALAVIPAYADATLAARVGRESRVFVLQHGWCHRNNSGNMRRPAELADGLPEGRVRCELANGQRRLDTLFGERFLPVLVPPFNYVSPHLARAVRELFDHVSCYGDFTGLPLDCTNVHADIIDWEEKRAAPSVDVVRTLILAVRLRRLGLVDAARPIGIMSHHLDHDESTWALLQTLLGCLTSHSCVSFPDIEEIFPLRAAPGVARARFERAPAQARTGDANGSRDFRRP